MSGDQMLQRRGLAADWASTNPVLGDGELGYATDTRALKIGDGTTPWNELTSLADLLSRVAKAGDIMTGRLQIPELSVTTSDTLTLFQDDGSTLGKFSAGEIYDNGFRVYSEAFPPSGGSMGFEEFTSSGTFVVPSGVTVINVLAVAGGGGSGGVKSNSDNFCLSGGGGAGQLIEKMLTVNPGDEIAVTIGAGGSGGTGSTPTAGGQGGNTTFGSLVTAIGGAGSAYVNGSGGTGGATHGGSGAGSSCHCTIGTLDADAAAGAGGGAGGPAIASTCFSGISIVSDDSHPLGGNPGCAAIFYNASGRATPGPGRYGLAGGGGGAGTDSGGHGYSMYNVHRSYGSDGGGRGDVWDGSGGTDATDGAVNTGGGAGGVLIYYSGQSRNGKAGGSGYLRVTWIG